MGDVAKLFRDRRGETERKGAAYQPADPRLEGGQRLPRGRAELVTSGIDEGVQVIGGDPFGRNAQVGLRVPALVPANGARYLFLLAIFSNQSGDKSAHLRGFRQLVTLGFLQTSRDSTGNVRIVEQEVVSPYWHPPDGNLSWHLQELGPPGCTGIPVPQTSNPSNRDNFAFRMSGAPALLYESATVPTPFYTSMTAYVPPNGGRPWGIPLLEGGMSTMYDLRANWRDDHAWQSLDVEVLPGRTVALFASLLQTNPATRVALTPPGGTFYPNGLSPEEQFLLNFPSAVYWRVAGDLIVDL